MNQTLMESKIVMDEKGKEYQFSYYRIEEETGYGICVESAEDSATVRDITPDRECVDVLLDVICRCAVSPAQLCDVVEDWLAEH